MNEIIMTTSTEVNTGSVKLDKAITKIATELKKGNKANHEVARTLYKIKTEELFTVTGHENFSEFAESYLGISKSQASRYTQVAERFLGEQKYEEYTISQLIEMLKASDEMLEYINPQMSAKDIREYIKGALALETNEDEDEDNTPDEGETPDEDNSTEESDDKPFVDENGYMTRHFESEKELSEFILRLAKEWEHVHDITITFKGGKAE